MIGCARETQPQIAEDRMLEGWVCANVDVRASKRLAPKRRRFDAVSDETIDGCIAHHCPCLRHSRTAIQSPSQNGSRTVNERYRINYCASTMAERRNGIAPFYHKGSVLISTGKARVAGDAGHQDRRQFTGFAHGLLPKQADRRSRRLVWDIAPMSRKLVRLARWDP